MDECLAFWMPSLLLVSIVLKLVIVLEFKEKQNIVGGRFHK